MNNSNNANDIAKHYKKKQSPASTTIDIVGDKAGKTTRTPTTHTNATTTITNTTNTTTTTIATTTVSSSATTFSATLYTSTPPIEMCLYEPLSGLLSYLSFYPVTSTPQL